MTQTQTQTSDIETQTQTSDIETQTQQNDEQNNEPQFIPLLDFEDDYEILNQYPFTIRRRDNHYVPSEWSRNGYPAVNLNGSKYYKHRLIAKQFIPNPNNLPQIDHWNRDRSDYHLENLRYISNADNGMNKTKSTSNPNILYEYVKSIPGESILVTDYNQHSFENYFFYNDVFYFYNGKEYRKLHVNEFKEGSKFVCLRNTNGKIIHVYYSRFKQIYDLD